MLAHAWVYPLAAAILVLGVLAVVVIRALSPIELDVTLRHPAPDKEDDDEPDPG